MIYFDISEKEFNALLSIYHKQFMKLSRWKQQIISDNEFHIINSQWKYQYEN